VQSEHPWWEIHDKEFEYARSHPPMAYVRLSENDPLHNMQRHRNEELGPYVFRKFSCWYLRDVLRWRENEEFNFELPDGNLFVVVLSNIVPILPELMPGRKRPEVRFGWSLGWSPDNVKRAHA